MAKELTDALDSELSRQETAPVVASAELFDLLVSVLADRVALELQGRQNGNEPAGREALLNLARRIRSEVRPARAGDTNERSDGSAAADNRIDIREKSPKYANIESLLRYNDTPDSGPGVKLVIMNFND
jgi:hypothetical protein